MMRCRRLLLLPLAALVSPSLGFTPNTAFTVTRNHHVLRTSSGRYPGRNTPRAPLRLNVASNAPEGFTTSDDAAQAAYAFPSDSIDTNKELFQKVVNAGFLAVCFGYGLYTILNIDHGMMRGWTQSEIAMRIPLDNWASYEAALMEKPIMTKTVINVIIYLLGDWLSQTLFQQKHVLDFDITRTLRNGLIGACFGPLVHQYYEFSDHILPVEGGLVNRGSKILMDQTLYLTVKCSLYITAVGLLAGDGWSKTTNNVKERIVPICITAWKFWPLVHCITYGLIPARHRILWVNCVDLVWNAILAAKANDDDDSSESSEEIPHCDEDQQLIESALQEKSTVISHDGEIQNVQLMVKESADARMIHDVSQLLEEDPALLMKQQDELFDAELVLEEALLPQEELLQPTKSANFTTSGLAHAP